MVDILYNNKLNWYDCVIDSEIKKDISSLSIAEKLNVINSFYKYLDVVKSETEKQMIISHVASKLSIDREAFNKDYLRIQKTNQYISNANNNNKIKNCLFYLQ